MSRTLWGIALGTLLAGVALLAGASIGLAPGRPDAPPFHPIVTPQPYPTPDYVPGTDGLTARP